jgi:hypothetical protein
MIEDTPQPMFVYKNMIVKGYKSVADLINRKRYPCDIPANIETPQIYEWSDGKFSHQLYEPIFHTLVPSKRTINDLIDFCFNRVDFRLHVDEYGRNPIFEIEWAVRVFLEQSVILQHQVKFRTDPDAQYIKIYLNKAQEAYNIFNRMLIRTLGHAKLPDNRIHPMDRLIASFRGITL